MKILTKKQSNKILYDEILRLWELNHYQLNSDKEWIIFGRKYSIANVIKIILENEGFNT